MHQSFIFSFLLIGLLSLSACCGKGCCTKTSCQPRAERKIDQNTDKRVHNAKELVEVANDTALDEDSSQKELA